MFVNYYYLALVPVVVAFRKFPLKNIIIGRAVFSTIVENLNAEFCTTPNVCFAVLNTNDRAPLQIVYVATALYVVNFMLRESAVKDTEKGLNVFDEYMDGRRLTNAALIVWAVLFTKNVQDVF
jgi:hypothetical protein